MSVRRDIVANYFGAGWAALMNVAFLPAFVRVLGLEGFGLIGFFTLLQSTLALLDFGLSPAVSRSFARANQSLVERQLAHDLLRSSEVFIFAVATALACGFAWIAPWLADEWFQGRHLDRVELISSLRVMGVVVGARLLENVYRGGLVGLQQQVRLNGVGAFVATLRGPGALLVLAHVVPSVNGYFCWQLAVSGVSILLLARVTRRSLGAALRPPRFDAIALRGLGKFAGKVLVVAALGLLLTQIDKILLSRLLDLHAFGLYSFGVAIAQTPLGLVGPVAQAFFPRFSAMIARGEEDGLKQAYHACSQIVSVLLGSATVIVVVFGEHLLTAWTRDGNLATQSYGFIVLLSLGSMLNGLMTVPYFLQMASGWLGLLIRTNLIAILLVIPALILVVPRYGPTGAAAVWLALNLGYSVVMLPAMHKSLLRGELAVWWKKDVLLPVGVAACVGLACGAGARLVTLPFLQWLALAASVAAVLLGAASMAPALRRTLFGSGPLGHD